MHIDGTTWQAYPMLRESTLIYVNQQIGNYMVYLYILIRFIKFN